MLIWLDNLVCNGVIVLQHLSSVQISLAHLYAIQSEILNLEQSSYVITRQLADHFDCV